METTKTVDSPAQIQRLDAIQLVRIDNVGSVVDVEPARNGGLSPRRWSGRSQRFLWVVVVPTVFVAVFFVFFAAPRYVADTSFIVRSASSGGSFGTGMAQSATLSSSRGSGDFADAVNSYILSRDMVDQLEKSDGLIDTLSRRESDFLFRFPNFYTKHNHEQLYRRYLKMVDAGYNKATGVNELSVTTFRPEDSQRLANALLLHAEELVNRLNERLAKDAESYAQSVVKRAQEHVVNIGLDLVKFRNSIGSVDPSRESATALDMIAQMTTEVAELQASLQQQIAMSPASPGIPQLRERIRTYQEQIEQEKLKIVGNDRSMTAKLSEFERLTLERQLAAREMDSALAGLAAARQDAQRQHLYLQRITEPNLADEAKYPKRLLSIAMAFALFFSCFVLINSIYKGIREHLA